MIRYRRGLFPILLWAALAWGQMGNRLPGGPGGEPGRNPYGQDIFAYRIYSFADSTDRCLNQVQFHFALVNDMLTFVKMSDTWYRANYELSVIIYNRKKEVAAFESIHDTVAVNDFASTNSRQRPMMKRLCFTLPPEDYTYQIQWLDAETQVNMGRPIALKLTDYSRPSLQISDLVMTDQQDCHAGLRRFTPNLREGFRDEGSQVGAYFELYGTGRDSITVEYSLALANGQKAGRRRYVVPGGVSAQCLQLNELITQPGEYLLSVQATAGAVRVKNERSFFVHWGRMPMQTQDGLADRELEQLALIARGHDLEKIRAASGSERQRLLAEFWQQRDPTPDTKVNELREEFFRRIDFADKNFSVAGLGLVGWKSDRGRVLVRNGTPDEIERHATEPGMPAVEIWQYRRLNKRFIFTDRQGSGDFRLVKVE